MPFSYEARAADAIARLAHERDEARQTSKDYGNRIVELAHERDEARQTLKNYGIQRLREASTSRDFYEAPSSVPAAPRPDPEAAALVEQMEARSTQNIAHYDAVLLNRAAACLRRLGGVELSDRDPITEAPHRIQLSRRKGWRMPENTVKVDRSTMWGNRWQVGTHSNLLGRPVATAEEAVGVYKTLAWPEPHHKALVREKLRGKNLACWCALDAPCHADVLLDLANGPVCT